ncbi:flagellar biosynthesis protein FlgM, partial [Sinorhizobium meliloti]
MRFTRIAAPAYKITQRAKVEATPSGGQIMEWKGRRQSGNIEDQRGAGPRG